jgi:CelD/BcsL family acetyltransferase involved in cellulose biosynthesis
MKYAIISSREDFLGLSQPWSELVACCEVDHAFMQHGWFDCWIRHFGRYGDLAIHTAWQDGQLVAIAPFQLTRERVGGLPVRALNFLSSGVSPRCHYIIHSSIDPSGFYRWIANRNVKYNVVLTKNLESNTRTTNGYLEFVGCDNRNQHIVSPGKISPYQVIDGDWNRYVQSLSKKLRQNVSQSMKRLARDHSYTIEKITDYPHFVTNYDRVVQASMKSWKAKIGRDLGSDRAMRDFLGDCASFASDHGLLEVWVLKAGDRVGAFNYCLKHRNRLCILYVDYDQDLFYYSPGSVLQYHMMEDLFRRNGRWEYDMCGQAYDYKLKWVDQTREHVSVIACSKTIRGGMAYCYRKWIYPRLKSWMHRVQAQLS